MLNTIHAKDDHFMKAFNHCVKCNFTKTQALIMANKLDSKGLVDASYGCLHYLLVITAYSARKTKIENEAS